ncbi:hypothetical protein MXB_3137, partial [Myxobolus squamalis]
INFGGSIKCKNSLNKYDCLQFDYSTEEFFLHKDKDKLHLSTNYSDYYRIFFKNGSYRLEKYENIPNFHKISSKLINILIIFICIYIVRYLHSNMVKNLLLTVTYIVDDYFLCELNWYYCGN